MAALIATKKGGVVNNEISMPKPPPQTTLTEADKMSTHTVDGLSLWIGRKIVHRCISL